MGVEITSPRCTDKCMELNFTNEGGALGRPGCSRTSPAFGHCNNCEPVGNELAVVFRGSLALPWPNKPNRFKASSPSMILCLLHPRYVGCYPRYLSANESGGIERSRLAVRSCLESLAWRYRICLEWLEEILGYSLKTIHVVGGGARNRLLCQMTADVCQREVIAGQWKRPRSEIS